MSQKLPVRSIGIVGAGVVGHATARSFIEWCEVRTHDILPQRCTHSLAAVLDADLVFICLPSPSGDGGGETLGTDLTAIHQFLSTLTHHLSLGAVGKLRLVLKSTVPVGTTRTLARQYGLDIVHSPEFLTARCSLVDAQMPARNIVGSPDMEKIVTPTDDGGYESTANPREAGSTYHLLCHVYRARFPHVPLLEMHSDESEAVKLMQNAFFGVKLAFWNEARFLADELGLNWSTVLGAILADGRIHPSHTQVPGPDGIRGFGGECLPKDLRSYVRHLEEHLIIGSHGHGWSPAMSSSRFNQAIRRDAEVYRGRSSELSKSQVQASIED